jgi:hypothetical protein
MRKQHTRNVVTLLFAVPVMAFGLTPAAQADEDANKLDDPRVEQLIHKANRRVAQGESPEVVERWLGSAVERLGVDKSPQSWDVYGRHRWAVEGNRPVQPD